MTTGSSGDAPVWSLPEEYLKTLAEHGSVKAYPKNAVIVNEGDQKRFAVCDRLGQGQDLSGRRRRQGGPAQHAGRRASTSARSFWTRGRALPR